VTSSISRVVEEVLGRVAPSTEERKKVRTATELARTRIRDELEEGGLAVPVEVGGSVAKDTWLSGDVDIDLFMLFPPSMSKKELGRIGLDVAKKAFKGYRQRERYAEHAYLETWVEDVRANIVPCYATVKGRWLSAADRSPYHTRYVVEKLEARHLMDDIRVFKRFVKGIDAYGAEIRVGGLSGYLCELLVLHYGSFEETLKAASGWRFREVIDPENLHQGRSDEARMLFPECLIVVDPVDTNRNVAAAVSKDSLSGLIVAAKLCLSSPSLLFFYPDEVQGPQRPLDEALSKLSYSLVALELRAGEEVPDILWGELHKTRGALRRLLESNGFVVMQSDVWSDEKGSSVMVFGLEALELSMSRKHLGPPGDMKGVESFLTKHANDADVGPWVEDGRWTVGLRTRSAYAPALLREELSSGADNVGVAKGLAQALASSKILVGSEVLGLASKKGFREFLAEFIKGRNRWLSAFYSTLSTSSSSSSS
jgi:tRNA nucleotidyltransferase (CCA-adding enzyme)